MPDQGGVPLQGPPRRRRGRGGARRGSARSPRTAKRSGRRLLKRVVRRVDAVRKLVDARLLTLLAGRRIDWSRVSRNVAVLRCPRQHADVGGEDSSCAAGQQGALRDTATSAARRGCRSPSSPPGMPAGRLVLQPHVLGSERSWGSSPTAYWPFFDQVAHLLAVVVEGRGRLPLALPPANRSASGGTPKP